MGEAHRSSANYFSKPWRSAIHFRWAHHRTPRVNGYILSPFQGCWWFRGTSWTV